MSVPAEQRARLFGDNYVSARSQPLRSVGDDQSVVPTVQSFRVHVLKRSKSCVWYDILAFSRPQHLLVGLGYSVVRRKQKRFGRESGAAAAMLKAISCKASRQ